MTELVQAVDSNRRVEDLELVLRRTIADLARAKSKGIHCRKWWRFWHRPDLIEIPGTFKCDRMEDFTSNTTRHRASLRLVCKCGHVQKFVVVVDP